MTERFEVPMPSQAAVDEYRTKTEAPNLRSINSGLHAAYAVDVPGIVRAEVERALRHFEIESYDYLAARFPEAAPENTKPPCGMGDDNCRVGVTACTRSKGHHGHHYSVHSDRSWPCVPTPSAPADSAVERVLASLAKAYPYLVKHANHIDGEFSSALAEVRRMLGAKAPATVRPDCPDHGEPKTVASVLNERLEPREWQKTEVWLSREEVERRFGVKVTPDGQTQAERDFLRALAESYSTPSVTTV